jgi:predicted TIM-barrel fold metal-dependent hydrolase
MPRTPEEHFERHRQRLNAAEAALHAAKREGRAVSHAERDEYRRAEQCFNRSVRNLESTREGAHFLGKRFRNVMQSQTAQHAVKEIERFDSFWCQCCELMIVVLDDQAAGRNPLRSTAALRENAQVMHKILDKLRQSGSIFELDPEDQQAVQKWRDRWYDRLVKGFGWVEQGNTPPPRADRDSLVAVWRIEDRDDPC